MKAVAAAIFLFHSDFRLPASGFVIFDKFCQPLFQKTLPAYLVTFRTLYF
jgi:hypothetical protein